jgi:hypothetical protein
MGSKTAVSSAVLSLGQDGRQSALQREPSMPAPSVTCVQAIAANSQPRPENTPEPVGW